MTVGSTPYGTATAPADVTFDIRKFTSLRGGLIEILATGTVVNGVAQSGLLNLASGTHTIVAVYSGDANFNPATRTQGIAGKTVGRLV